MRKLNIIALFLVIAGSSFADNIFDKLSNYANRRVSGIGFSELKLGIGARNISLGDATSSVTGDATSVYWNPARLTTLNNMAIAASHTAYFQGMRQEFAGIAKNGFGIGIYEFYSGEIELRDERQKWLGNYSGTGIVSYISYARKIYEDVSIGTTFKGIYEKLWVNTLKGYAFDFGLNYIPVSALSVSAVVDNIGPTMHYGIDNAERIRLPFMVKIGSSYTYQNLLFCAELRKAIDEVLRGNIGLELSPLPQLSLRMGYRIKYDTENFSAGLGLNYKNYKIDYAFVPMRLNLGSCHWLTLGAMLP